MLTRPWIRSPLVLVAAAALATACGGPAGLDGDAPATDELASVSVMTADVTLPSINEGSATAARFQRVCVNSNTDTTLSVSWGDGSPNDSRIEVGGAFPQNTVTCPGVGNFEACGTTRPCTDIPHTYADDDEGTPFAVVISSNNGGGVPVTQGTSVAVANLPPVLTNLQRLGSSGTDEGTLQTITAQVNDPGTLGNEVVDIVFTVTPPGTPPAGPANPNNTEPVSVTCTCGGNVLLCPGAAPTTCHGGIAQATFRWVDNGNFSVAAVLTDEDGATANASIGPFAIANQSPVNPTVSLTDNEAGGDPRALGYSNLLVSNNAAARTTVVEGFNYNATFGIQDQGIDSLNWTWSFASATATGTGNGVVINATRPNLDPASVTITETSDTVEWNDSHTTQLDFAVSDDDGATTPLPRFVAVRDVSPLITSFATVPAGVTAVNEGGTVTVSVAAASGDFGSGFDNLGNRHWRVASTGATACNTAQTATGAAASTYDATTGRCWLRFNGPQTFAAAQTACTTAGGVLASIHSSNENSIVAALASGAPGGTAWIAYNDQAQEGSFIWTDTTSADDFKSFGGGEPNDAGGNEDCVQIFGGGNWNDITCGAGFPFVCAVDQADDITGGAVNGGSAYVVDSGCGLADNTCTVRFLDDTAASPYGLQVIVDDEDSRTHSPPTVVTVNNVVPTFTYRMQGGASIAHTATTTVNVSENSANNATFEVSSVDPAGNLDGPYGLTIRFGDGNTASGTATSSQVIPGAFAAIAHAYLDNDPVNGAGPPPVLCAQTPAANGNVGACIADIQVCEVGATICSDFDGGVGGAQRTPVTVNVANVTPVVTVASVNGGVVIPEGSTFALDGSFTDVAGALDDLYTFQWSWNDNNGGFTSVAATTTIAANAVDITGPAFTEVPAAGLSGRAFTLNVTDEDSGLGTANRTLSVAGIAVSDSVPTADIIDFSFDDDDDGFFGDSNDENTRPSVLVCFAAGSNVDTVRALRVDWGDGTPVRNYCSIGSTVSEFGSPGVVTPISCDVDDDGEITGVGTGGNCFNLEKPERWEDSDGNFLPGHVTAGTSDPFRVLITVIDEDSGTVANDDIGAGDGNNANGFEIDVNNLAPEFVSFNPDPTSAAVAVSEGTAAAFIINATDASNTDVTGDGLSAFDMTLQVDWDDGSPVETFSPSSFQAHGGSIPFREVDAVFRAAHVYTAPQTFNVTFTLIDKEGGTRVTNGTVDVVNIPPVITDVFNTGPVDEGSEITTVALVDNRGADILDYNFVDDCDAADFDNDAIYGGAGQTSAVHESTFADDDGAPHNVCVRVCDEDAQPNSCVYDFEEAVIENVAPTLALVSAPANATIAEGGTVTITGNVSDVGAPDTHTVTFDCTDDGTTDTTDTTAPFTAACVYAQSGTFVARVTATDDDGGVTDRTLTVRVNNAAPIANTFTGPATTAEGTTATFTATATDTLGDALVLQVDANNDGVFDLTSSFAGAVNPRTATAGVFFASSSATPRTIAARVCDSDGSCTAFTSASITVTNVAPSAPVASATTVGEGQPTVLQAASTDVGGDAITYEFDVSGAGTFATFLTSSSGAASTTFATDGSKSISVRARDSDGGVSTTTTFSATVNNLPPVLGTVSATTVDEGAPTQFAATGSDPGDDPLTFEFDFDSSGAGAFVVDASSTSGLASTTFSPDGAHTTRVRVRDNANALSAVQTVTATVNNGAPVITSLTAPTAVNEGVATATVTANFVDAGGDSLTAQVDCNDDGAADTSTQTGNTSVTANCAAFFGQSGVFVVRVTVFETANPTATTDRTAIVRVNNAAPVATSLTVPIVGAEGTTATRFTAQASDAGNDDLVLQLDTDGNGSFEQTQAFPSGAGARTVNFNFTYATSGSKTVAGRVCDGEGLCTTYTAPAPFTVANVAPTAPTASAAAVNEGTASLLAAASSDVGGDGIRFEFDLDSSAGPFVVDLTSTSGTVSFAFPTDGAHSIRVHACDTDALDPRCSADTTFTATVNNVAPVIGAVNAPSISSEGAAVTVATQASDAGGDALQFSYTFTRTGGGAGSPLSVAASSNPVASIVLPEDGTWTVTATASDGAAPPVNANATITVQNLAPVVATFPQPAAINEGAVGTLTLTATASDAGGANDPLTFAFDCNDDGVAEQTGASTSATCPHPTSGTFQARVRVTDDEGASSDRTTVIRVNNLAPTFTAAVTASTVAEGAATVFTGTATDAGGDIVTVQIDTNGDNVFDLNAPVDGTGNVNVSFNYGASRTLTAHARACDNEGACSAAQDVTVSVTNAAPIIDSIQVPGVAVAGAPVTANVAARDPGGDALTYTFAYRQGALPAGSIGPQGVPSATNTFSESGTYSLDVTVDDGEDSTTQTVTFVVTELSVDVVGSASPNPINEGQSSTVTVVPNGTGPYEVSFDITGDGDFIDARDVQDFPCDGDAINPCEATALFPQNRAGDIAFRILVLVRDTGNNDAISTALIALDVLNVAPTIVAVGDATQVEQGLFTTDVNVTDPGIPGAPVPGVTPDSITFELVEAPPGMTIDEDSGVIAWTPDYTDEGTNDVIVRATDSDDARAVDEAFTVTVTIIDTNGNSLSDTFEREVNDGNLFPPGADTTDTDGDGETDLVELLNGSDPNTSDRARAPILISPDNGETVDDAQPTLTVANAFSPRGLDLTYTFCVVDDSGDEIGCEVDVPEGESITSVVFDEEPLGEQGTFTWYAFAYDGLVDGEESLRGSFVLDAVNVAPPTPELLSPIDETVFVEGTLPALEARAVVDGDGDTVLYTFEVATDAAFGADDVLVTSDARAVPLFSFGQVLDVGTYFWRVTASDGIESSAPSQSRSFTIDAEEENVAPSEPRVASPNDTTITAGNATLTIQAATDANGDELSYEFELATNAVFAGAERFPATAALTQAVTQLDDDTTYFWRARAFDGALASDWVAASFHVNSENDAPTGLLLLTPPDGSVLNEAPVQFMARGAKDVDDTVLSYTFEVAEDKEFARKVAEETFDESGDIVSWIPAAALELKKGKSYFWRVRVVDADNATIEATASFTMFKKVTVKEPVTVAAGGGGLCSSSGSSPSGIALMGLVVVVLGARRRRQG